MKKTYKALLCGAAAVAAVGIAYAMDERFFEKAKDKLTVFKCRANSKIMEQALPLTDAMFPGPKVVSGADSAKKIPEVLKELNVNKVMIVTGPTVGRTIVPPIAENLERHGIGYTIYDQVEANPSVKTVEAIRAQYLENGCDGFLAIGGGSPMDAAKAKAARDYGTYIELNSKKKHLSDEELERVRDTGVRFLVNSDAHSVDRIGDTALVDEQLERVKIPRDRIDNIDGRLPNFRFREYKERNL